MAWDSGYRSVGLAVEMSIALKVPAAGTLYLQAVSRGSLVKVGIGKDAASDLVKSVVVAVDVMVPVDP